MRQNDLPKRKNIRLRDYDYGGNGCYFIAVCTEGRKCIFWEPGGISGQNGPRLSRAGQFVDRAIRNIPDAYPDVFVEKYAVMPNHVHLLIGISAKEGSGTEISRIIKQMKEFVTKQAGAPVWQKSFYDHVVRDDDFQTKWNYIDTNPLRWGEDEYF